MVTTSKVLKHKTSPLSKDMTIIEILDACPNAEELMLSYGLHCIGCHISAYETLEEGCASHGLTDGDIDCLMREINDLLQPTKKVVKKVVEKIPQAKKTVKKVAVKKPIKRK